MADKRVKLLRPLNGAEVGTEAEYSAADAARLEASGAVEILGDVERKADKEPDNKMEAAPTNKGRTARAPRE